MLTELPKLLDVLDCKGVCCFMNVDSYEHNVIQPVPPESQRHFIKTFLSHTVKPYSSSFKVIVQPVRLQFIMDF